MGYSLISPIKGHSLSPAYVEVVSSNFTSILNMGFIIGRMPGYNVMIRVIISQYAT